MKIKDISENPHLAAMQLKVEANRIKQAERLGGWILAGSLVLGFLFGVIGVFGMMIGN